MAWRRRSKKRIKPEDLPKEQQPDEDSEVVFTNGDLEKGITDALELPKPQTVPKEALETHVDDSFAKHASDSFARKASSSGSSSKISVMLSKLYFHDVSYMDIVAFLAGNGLKADQDFRYDHIRDGHSNTTRSLERVLFIKREHEAAVRERFGETYYETLLQEVPVETMKSMKRYEIQHHLVKGITAAACPVEKTVIKYVDELPPKQPSDVFKKVEFDTVRINDIRVFFGAELGLNFGEDYDIRPVRDKDGGKRFLEHAVFILKKHEADVKREYPKDYYETLYGRELAIEELRRQQNLRCEMQGARPVERIFIQYVDKLPEN